MEDAFTNSKPYWEDRFRSCSWNDNGGESQSAFFSMLAINALPAWLVRRIEQNTWVLKDYGCAAGAGTAALASRFPMLQVTGVDFAEAAVFFARQNHPHCSFVVGDITGELEKADIVFSSNTLEHFRNAPTLLKHLVDSAEHYAVFLLPFEEQSEIDEHVYVFTIHSFPEQIGSHRLRFFKVIDCRDMENSAWLGKQILLVYAAESELSILPDTSISELYESLLQPLIEQSHSRAEALVQQQQQCDALLLSSLQLQQQNDELQLASEEIYSIWRAFDSSLTHQEDAGDQARRLLSSMSHSRPHRLAHFFVELWHAFFGKKKDRFLGKQYLLHGRQTVTRFNYMAQMRKSFGRLLNTRALRHQNDKLQRAHERIQKQLSAPFLRNLIANYAGDVIILLPELIDWNIPLFQRPEQLAMAFAHHGILFVYTTPNHIDALDRPRMLEENLLLMTKAYIPVIMELAKDYGKHVIFDICSTDNRHFDDWFALWDAYPHSILYEYIDEISAEITNHVPEDTLRRHSSFLANEEVFVVATAEKLYQEVLEKRGNDIHVIYSTNGVDVSHFLTAQGNAALSPAIQDYLSAGQPVIGYFGAIASWFDFDLIDYAAMQRADYRFLLIGPNYEHHKLPQIERLKKRSNVLFTGPIDYAVLPSIANSFTVATIPFVLNEITESTSPIKLFEYMSMGKPIVTTAMRECMKYPEVIIAQDPADYVRCLDQAVAIATGPDCAAYAAQQRRAANRNSWEEKAREIIRLLEIGGC